MIDLTAVNRNRMLAQREQTWRAERSVAIEIIDLLDNNYGYRAAMNIFANFIIMNTILWSSEKPGKKINDALKGESGLSIWGDAEANVTTLALWLSRGRKWKVEETSELFRIFVVVIESVQYEYETNHETDNIKIIKIQSSNYQFTNGDLSRYTSDFTLDSLSPDGFNLFFDEVNKVKNTTLNGVSLFKKTRSDDPIDPSGPRSRESEADILNRITGISSGSIASMRRLARMLTNGSGGTNIHSLKPNSLVGTVEWIYGLASGADTSGTTAEIVGLCKLFEKYLPTDEINGLTTRVPWYLGPVLAMIKNGHHTLLESAIAISIGECPSLGEETWPINYIPCTYSSLLKPATGPESSLMTDIRAQLAAYELKNDSTIFFYRPEKGAWTPQGGASVSLTGGTIINNYTYHDRSGSQVAKLPLPKLLHLITKSISQDDSDDKDVLKQARAIYELIIAATKD